MSNEARVQELIARVNHSVSQARAEQSKLQHHDFGGGSLSSCWKGVNSMNGPKYLHLINNLCAYPDVTHLNIGFFEGGTLLPCFEGNPLTGAFCIDNFFSNDYSPESQKHTFRTTFMNNAKRLGFEDRFILFDEDFHTFDVSKITTKINFHIYDADHSEESQYQGVFRFGPVFEDVFILLVDDYLMGPDSSMAPAQLGTRRAIKDLGYTMHLETVISGEFQNSQGILVLEKP